MMSYERSNVDVVHITPIKAMLNNPIAALKQANM